MTPYDSSFAIKQMEMGHKELLHRPVYTLPVAPAKGSVVEVDGLGLHGKVHPRIISMGGELSSMGAYQR